MASLIAGLWHPPPKERAPASYRVRALFCALRQWWSKERYRPERRYMRG
ncbi:MAG TPA: hypothetical protein VEX11_13255 [Acetobacteraceae bacterium]|jgi:hypothetical protein|nr:hypothetical protein [Acetobacteraceae bacterium]